MIIIVSIIIIIIIIIIIVYCPLPLVLIVFKVLRCKEKTGNHAFLFKDSIILN